MISVSGFLGTSRWYRVGNGDILEVILGMLLSSLLLPTGTNLNLTYARTMYMHTALAGFASLIMTALFELDVVPDRFLEDKLIVTGWLIEKLKMDSMVDFDVNDFRSEKFLEFLRQSPDIYHLYDEDIYLGQRGFTAYNKFSIKQGNLWGSMHILGAISFVTLVTTSILLHDLVNG